MSKQIKITEVNHSERAHAVFSASGSSRWLACPASIKVEADLPNSSSVFAQEGTRAHEVADLCLKNGVNAIEYLGADIEGGIVDDDMVHYVQKYLDYVRDIANQFPDPVLMFEQRVDFSNIAVEGTFGTLDASVLSPSARVLHIFDLKYGKGVAVDAENNTQGLCYASGILNEMEFYDSFDTIVIHIVQPRIHNYSEWAITIPDLKKWQEYVRERVALAISDNPPFGPSDYACQWCKAKSNCKALATFLDESIVSHFVDLDDTNDLSDAEVRRFLDLEPLLTRHLKALNERVDAQLRRGEPFEGYKLIKGQSRTKFLDGAEEELVAIYGEEDLYQRKFIGITEGKKILSKDDFARFTYKADGEPKMVPESAKGEAITIEPMFGSIE